MEPKIIRTVPHDEILSLCRSPHNGIKVMSVGLLLEEADSAVVWRGPRKTALIKRFLKDTFWGRLDYLIFDILFCKNCICVVVHDFVLVFGEPYDYSHFVHP